MNTALSLDNSGGLRYSPIVPPTLLTYLLKGFIPVAVSGPFGDFLFQQVQTPEAEVWYSNYLLVKDSRINSISKLPKLELQFGLNNTFTYHGKGLGDRELHDGSFNLLYVPSVDNQLHLQAGRIYTTFDIHLSPKLLSKLAEYFPVLGTFLDKIAKGEAALLCPLNQVTTIEMTRIVDEILKNRYMGTVREFYTVTKVMELLIVVLEKISNQPIIDRIFFRKEEIEKIYTAKDELLKNLDKPVSLLILSRKVGLNMHKLKSGFQQFYGSSVLIYRLHARMKEAKRLLNDTDDQVDNIGYATGYANSQHFSKAYKKYYGHTPAQQRKTNGQK